MHIVLISFAIRNQFSPIFDLLSADHSMTLVAPPGTGDARGMPHLPFAVPDVRDIPATARLGAHFVRTAESVRAALVPIAGEAVDLVFGQVSFGCLHKVREAVDAAVVAHVELPGLEQLAARPEFPLSQQQQRDHKTRTDFVCADLRTADLVITPTAYARGLLPADIGMRTRVSMEGFVPQPWRGIDERLALRRRYGLPTDAPIIGYFGRTLEAVRGFDRFVQAAAEVRRRLPQARFVVLGAPLTHYGNEGHVLGKESFRDYALRMAGISEDDFIFLGWQPREVCHQLQAAVDVALFPLYESAGNWSFFETLAAGTAVVAARRHFFPEVIRDGENGVMVDVDDPLEQAERCLELLADNALRVRLGRAAWELVRRQFTLEHALARYLAIFAEAIERRAMASRGGGV